MNLRRKKRVRVHLIDQPGIDMPRFDGILISRRAREFVLGVPEMTLAANAQPVRPEGRLVVVPRERVAFYEIL